MELLKSQYKGDAIKYQNSTIKYLFYAFEKIVLAILFPREYYQLKPN